jgi:hypothetical protein
MNVKRTYGQLPASFLAPSWMDYIYLAVLLSPHVQAPHNHAYCNFSFSLFFLSVILLYIMSHNRYMSWPDALTMAPSYPPPGAGTEYPSPAASRRASECFSDMNPSRRGSLAGFASEMESTGQWQSIGSESKSPLAQFGFFKNLTEKKTTRGLHVLQHTLHDTHESTDGQPAKRRGPKPDSKPALTRRQELNRQAQR